MENNPIKSNEPMGSHSHIFIAGPLTLNSHTNQAHIVLQPVMQLTPDEFDILFMLAMRENIPLSFETLYNALWDSSDETDNREYAWDIIVNLATRISAAGNGFIWIEYEESSGFTFRTNWNRS